MNPASPLFPFLPSLFFLYYQYQSNILKQKISYLTLNIFQIGSFCLSNMGFIYPAFIELNLDWEDPGPGFLRWRLWKFIAILAFGTLLCIVGTYTNAREMVKEVFHLD